MNDIDAVVFDLYGTLLDPSALAAACADVTGAPNRLVEHWRQKQLEYTWLRSVMGQHKDFWKVTGDALDFALRKLGLEADPAARSRLLNAWLVLPPFPDTFPALSALAPRRLAVLSNGTPDMLAAALTAARLDGLVGTVLSVEQVGVFKPHPSVYALAPAALDLPVERILFVSSNGWDATGAKAAGLPVAWVNRSSAKAERLGFDPDLVVRDLAALAAELP